MTTFIVDIASYQAGLNLDVVKAAGFTGLNIKTSQGNWYQYADAAAWASAGRSRGMSIGTFHWLDNSDTGANQAQIAYNLFTKLGGPANMWHQCDCEDNATYEIWRTYVDWWQQKLGRHIVNYTGDWWWHTAGRDWNGVALTPYNWAAPNVGYRTTYPGDASADWTCGYGGWANYALLQYAVQAIPNAGGGNVSKTAVRDPAILPALMGSGGTTMTTLDTLIDTKSPAGQRALWQIIVDLWYGLNGYGSADYYRVLRDKLGTTGLATATALTDTDVSVDALASKVDSLVARPEPPTLLAIQQAVGEVLGGTSLTLTNEQVTELATRISALLTAPAYEGSVTLVPSASAPASATAYAQPATGGAGAG